LLSAAVLGAGQANSSSGSRDGYNSDRSAALGLRVQVATAAQTYDRGRATAAAAAEAATATTGEQLWLSSLVACDMLLVTLHVLIMFVFISISSGSRDGYSSDR
jgi:heme/copper-type cytochrome/quinol oxidase subunit 2